MKHFELTAGELKAAKILVQSCLDGMGGSRPSDLEHDEYTWVNIDDLVREGYSQAQAKGFFSSLHKKGFIDGEYDPTQCETFVTTDGWKFIDTVWEN